MEALSATEQSLKTQIAKAVEAAKVLCLSATLVLPGIVPFFNIFPRRMLLAYHRLNFCLVKCKMNRRDKDFLVTLWKKFPDIINIINAY